MKQIHLFTIMLLVLFIGYSPAVTFSAEKELEKKTETIAIPDSVVNIGKENTFTNQAQDIPQLKPSEFTKELLATAEEKIENPHLIRILNESYINKTPLSIGTRASIFLGEWALGYHSFETIPNWEFQKVNTNVYDNTSGNANYQINYVQQAQKKVLGGLTAKVPHAEDVQNMMTLKAMNKTKLPLTTEAVIGAGTKHHQIYNIQPKQQGYLHAFAPALIEKGEVTYGEVYLEIKGMKRRIVIKNVTSQTVGAWLPIQDHLTFTFHSSS